MLISRRSLFAGALATATVLPAAKALAAPSSSWLSYEARLKARLADAGGGRFDRGFAQALLRGVNNFRNPSRLPARLAAAPALQPGVWQLRPVTPRGGNTYDVLAGPIFIV